MPAARIATLIEAAPPAIAEPTAEPAIPAATYAARQAAALARAAQAGLDALVVSGDREHMANLSFLTGHDPRFEEAVLVLAPDREATLLVGNEGWAYAELAPGPFTRVLHQSLSLMGQPRDRVRPVDHVLRDTGLAAGMRIGAVGWKGFTPEDTGSDATWLEIPSWLADSLRRIAGDPARVVNANDLFMNPAHGLRAINCADQLACFEFAACLSSDALRRVLLGLRPDITEYEAARLMQLNGFPLSAHVMLSTGTRARAGLPSPSIKRIERGEPFTMACALWGALNARAGFVVADAAELPPAIRDYVPRLVAPYFTAIVAWYEALRIGVTGRTLWHAVHDVIGDPFFGVTLNPGHLIHLDEWMHSPIARDSDIELRSGMALQADVIPATGTEYFTTNIEDGMALADAALRAELAARYPEAWSRIQVRRAFMRDTIGIRLHEDVLPFSNIPAFLPPFLLSPTRIMAMREE
jgi:hypothetical protein